MADMAEYQDFKQFLKERSRAAIREKILENYIRELRSMQNKYGLDLERVDRIDHLREVLSRMEKQVYGKFYKLTLVTFTAILR